MFARVEYAGTIDVEEVFPLFSSVAGNGGEELGDAGCDVNHLSSGILCPRVGESQDNGSQDGELDVVFSSHRQGDWDQVLSRNAVPVRQLSASPMHRTFVTFSSE